MNQFLVSVIFGVSILSVGMRAGFAQDDPGGLVPLCSELERIQSPPPNPEEFKAMRDSAQILFQSLEDPWNIPVQLEDDERCVSLNPSESCVADSVLVAGRALAHSGASLVASFLTTAVVYPLDTQKIRRQSESPIRGQHYRGFLAYSSALGASSAIHFPLYEELRSREWSPFLSAVVASGAATLVSSPFWVYRTRRSLYETRSEGNPGAGQGSYSIQSYLKEVRLDPKLGFHGLGMGILCWVPQILQMQIYERLSQEIDQWTEVSGSESLAARKASIASSASRVLVAGISFPLETLRLIRQKSGESYPKIIQSLSDEGYRRFYRGFFWGVSKQTLWIAGYMELYHGLKEQIDRLPDDASVSKSQELR